MPGDLSRERPFAGGLAPHAAACSLDWGTCQPPLGRQRGSKPQGEPEVEWWPLRAGDGRAVKGQRQPWQETAVADRGQGAGRGMLLSLGFSQGAPLTTGSRQHGRACDGDT